jgi:hypothetical protein
VASQDGWELVRRLAQLLEELDGAGVAFRSATEPFDTIPAGDQPTTVGGVKVVAVPRDGWRRFIETWRWSGRRASNPLPQPWQVETPSDGLEAPSRQFNSSGFVRSCLLRSVTHGAPAGGPARVG